MLSFIPTNKTPLQQAPELLEWIESWSGPNLEILEPRDWYIRGHDLIDGSYDQTGFWRWKVKKGTFLWQPPPAAADVALEELRRARHKRQDSLHIFIVHRLMAPEWRKQLYKAVDVVFEIPADSPGWPGRLHEPLMIGLLFPFLSCRPWQLRSTPKMFYMDREMRRVLQTKDMASGDLLREFLLEIRKFPALSPDVVWSMLYFSPRVEVPHPQFGDRDGRRRKRSALSSEVGASVGTEAPTSG